MRIIFHIGMGKTGTSSVQHVLQNHAKELAEQSAAYLGIWFGAVDPSFDGQQGFISFISQTAEQMVASADKFHANLVDRAAKERVETLIFSNEGLYEAGHQLHPFFNRLKAKGSEMSFVIYARDPRAWLPSAYTQWGIRHKTNSGAVLDFTTLARHLINRYELIRFWQQNFGESLTVRPFETGTDVVQDFANTAGLTLPGSGTRELDRCEPADILLRAMFNNRFPDPVLPSIFDSFLNNVSQTPVTSLREMTERCFSHDGVEEVLAEHRDLFEFIRDRVGIDFVDSPPRPSKMPDEAELQRRVVDYLVEITFDQAHRIKRLERLVDEMQKS